MAVDKPTQYTATMAKPPRIDGVKTKPLRVIPDERGWLMEILRADDAELFTKFGQTYVSATYPGGRQGLALPPPAGRSLRLRRGHGEAGARRHASGLADQRRDQRVLHRHAEPDAGAGAEPRLSRLEVHQHRDRRSS